MSLSGLHALIFRVKCGASMGGLIVGPWIGENGCLSHKRLEYFHCMFLV